MVEELFGRIINENLKNLKNNHFDNKKNIINFTKKINE